MPTPPQLASRLGSDEGEPEAAGAGSSPTRAGCAGGGPVAVSLLAARVVSRGLTA